MVMHPIIAIPMTDTLKLLSLQTWMSAAFPTGAFTCSHGIEQAISDGRISDADSCEDWISGIMQYGSGWNDALLMADAYAIVSAAGKTLDFSDNTCIDNRHWLELKESLRTLNDLALALCSGAERLRETTQLGQAFSNAVAATTTHECVVTSLLESNISLPVSIGVSGAVAGIPARQLLPASLQASSSNLIWIATRLIPLGQSQALYLIAKLQPLMAQLGQAALQGGLDDLGSSALLADMASIEHEQLHSRICIT